MNVAPLDVTIDLRVIDGDADPRILDLRVAERLGFANPLMIRKLIKRNLGEFQQHGNTFHRGKKSATGRGRPSQEFWLNEAQAILACMISEAPLAPVIRTEIIAVFRDYRRGRLVRPSNLPAIQQPDAFGAIFEQKLAPIHRKLDDHGVELTALGDNVVQIKRRVEDLAPHRDFAPWIIEQWTLIVLKDYGGKCPSCKERQIVSIVGIRLDNCHADHANSREKHTSGDGWLVCNDCNGRFERDPPFREEKRKRFLVFQEDYRRRYGCNPRRKSGRGDGRTVSDSRQHKLFLDD